jgi:hypothetical protein
VLIVKDEPPVHEAQMFVLYRLPVVVSVPVPVDSAPCVRSHHALKTRIWVEEVVEVAQVFEESNVMISPRASAAS